MSWNYETTVPDPSTAQARAFNEDLRELIVSERDACVQALLNALRGDCYEITFELSPQKVGSLIKKHMPQYAAKGTAQMAIVLHYHSLQHRNYKNMEEHYMVMNLVYIVHRNEVKAGDSVVWMDFACGLSKKLYDPKERTDEYMHRWIIDGEAKEKHMNELAYYVALADMLNGGCGVPLSQLKLNWPGRAAIEDKQDRLDEERRAKAEAELAKLKTAPKEDKDEASETETPCDPPEPAEQRAVEVFCDG